MIAIVFIFVVLAFLLSASAGMGGSLILIPIMSLALGAKTGIAVSAVLLGCNNIFKAIAYRKTIPLKKCLLILLLTMLGAAVGSKVMIRTSEEVLSIAIVVCLVLSFLFEQKKWERIRQKLAPIFALSAGLTSGFTGTSGPLKGMALRSLRLDRFYFVGAASVISLMGDLVKCTVYFQASLFDTQTYQIFLLSVFAMPIAVYTGKFINEKIGEQAYSILFWVVMLGYSCRLILI